MFNDMIVVVEDLRNVEFNLILVDKRSKLRLKKSSGSSNSNGSGNNNCSQQQQQKSSPSVPILEYHSFPLPRITGSRSSLKVSQGVIYRNLSGCEKNLSYNVQRGPVSRKNIYFHKKKIP